MLVNTVQVWPSFKKNIFWKKILVLVFSQSQKELSFKTLCTLETVFLLQFLPFAVSRKMLSLRKHKAKTTKHFNVHRISLCSVNGI